MSRATEAEANAQSGLIEEQNKRISHDVVYMNAVEVLASFVPSEKMNEAYAAIIEKTVISHETNHAISDNNRWKEAKVELEIIGRKLLPEG